MPNNPSLQSVLLVLSAITFSTGVWTALLIRSIHTVRLSVTHVIVQNTVCAVTTWPGANATPQCFRWRCWSRNAGTVHLIWSILTVDTAVTHQCLWDTVSSILTEKLGWEGKKEKHLFWLHIFMSTKKNPKSQNRLTIIRTSGHTVLIRSIRAVFLSITQLGWTDADRRLRTQEWRTAAGRLGGSWGQGFDRGRGFLQGDALSCV